MGKEAMLSVDIKNTTSEQREKFDKKLLEFKWTKFSKLTTVWKASFGETFSKLTVISIAKTDVREAANIARITNYDAVVHIGDSYPTLF